MDDDLWGGLILVAMVAFTLWGACGGRYPQVIRDFFGAPPEAEDPSPADQDPSDRSRE